ncbi:hypothetical protein PSZ72_24990 [Shigella sonnei]|nr:hypothetical protein [Shigella sonnei]
MVYFHSLFWPSSMAGQNRLWK